MRKAHAARRGLLVDLIGDKNDDLLPPSANVGDREITLLDRMIEDNERERDTQKVASRHIEQIIEDDEREAARAAERIRVRCNKFEAVSYQKYSGHDKDKDGEEEEYDDVSAKPAVQQEDDDDVNNPSVRSGNTLTITLTKKRPCPLRLMLKNPRP